jgi:hypothetical protein
VIFDVLDADAVACIERVARGADCRRISANVERREKEVVRDVVRVLLARFSAERVQIPAVLRPADVLVEEALVLLKAL